MLCKIRTQDTVRSVCEFSTGYQRGQHRTETPSGVAISGQLFLGKHPVCLAPRVPFSLVAHCRYTLYPLGIRDTIG